MECWFLPFFMIEVGVPAKYGVRYVLLGAVIAACLHFACILRRYSQATRSFSPNGMQPGTIRYLPRLKSANQKIDPS